MITDMWYLMNGCDAECSGATTEILWKMGGGIYDKRFYCGLGPDCWVWIWWVGEHDKFHTPDWHIWALYKVLPVSTTSTASFTSITQRQRHRNCSSTPPLQPHSQPLICATARICSTPGGSPLGLTKIATMNMSSCHLHTLVIFVTLGCRQRR